ncbi:MAG: hypothetical protein HY036_09025 [Nitrospirae bacterium]|nr:hypothetical protein [Nitrospirota bacterium]
MKKPYDLIIIGWIFLSNVLIDSYLIFANPHYALKLFGTSFTGIGGWIAKIQSPVLHGFIGIGFLKQKRWSYLLYMAYATFGLVNAFANLYLLGYGRIRMIFIISLIAITLYIYFRRQAFKETMANRGIN